MKKTYFLCAFAAIVLASCGVDACDCKACIESNGIDTDATYGISCLNVLPDCWEEYGDGISRGTKSSKNRLLEKVRQECND